MKKRVFEFLLITFGWVFTVSFCVAIQLSGKSNVLVALMVASLANVCFYTVLFLLHRYEQKERIREIVYGDLPLIVTIHETKSDTITLRLHLANSTKKIITNFKIDFDLYSADGSGTKNFSRLVERIGANEDVTLLIEIPYIYDGMKVGTIRTEGYRYIPVVKKRGVERRGDLRVWHFPAAETISLCPIPEKKMEIT